MALKWGLMFLCGLQRCVNSRDGEPYSNEESLVALWPLINGICVIEFDLPKN